MSMHGKDIKIFAGNSNIELAKRICADANIPFGNAVVGRFSDGEIATNICEIVRGSDVFIIQSTSDPVNDNLMELLIMCDAVRRASAGRVTAVIPYFGYARQDRKARARDPISAKLVANLITVAGADRVLTMDLHAPQIQGFFDIPVDHLHGAPVLAQYFKESFENWEDVVVVSPDVGSVTRSRKFAQCLDSPLAIIDKRRPKANASEVLNIIGEVKGKTVVMVDDIIDTGGTIVNGAKALMDFGAKEVYVCCTHAVFSGPAIERLAIPEIKEVITLDTIQLPADKYLPKIKVLSVSGIFAEAIKRIFGDLSISQLFTQKDA